MINRISTDSFYSDENVDSAAKAKLHVIKIE